MVCLFPNFSIIISSTEMMVYLIESGLNERKDFKFIGCVQTFDCQCLYRSLINQCKTKLADHEMKRGFALDGNRGSEPPAAPPAAFVVQSYMQLNSTFVYVPEGAICLCLCLCVTPAVPVRRYSRLPHWATAFPIVTSRA